MLILADKIDLKKSRVSDAGKQVEGIRQCQYINDIQFDINNGNFQINFMCDEKMNLEELNITLQKKFLEQSEVFLTSLD